MTLAACLCIRDQYKTCLLLLPGFACSQTCLTTHPPRRLGHRVHTQQSRDYCNPFSARAVPEQPLLCPPYLQSRGGLQACPLLPQTETRRSTSPNTFAPAAPRLVRSFRADRTGLPMTHSRQ